MAAGGSRFDISRFGMEVMRFSPRQGELYDRGWYGHLQDGRVGAVESRRQMAEPEWVVAMGLVPLGGMCNSYATLQGVDRVVRLMST